MDSYSSRVILPAVLGIIGAILSGCLGGLVGYSLPFHRDRLMRRLIRRRKRGEPPGNELLLRGRLSARQGVDMVELRPGASLRAVDLTERNLEAVDLRGANLEGANLQGAILQRCNLAKARLSGSNLWGANLLGCDLRRSDLRYAMMRGADLGGANLLRADLRGADLAGANLRGANLEGADLLGADLSRADLTWAKTDRRTSMPDGWMESVAGRPARSTATASHRAGETRGDDCLVGLNGQSPPQMID